VKLAAKMKYWVYIDSDHGDVALFKNLYAAQAHAELNWPNEDGETKWEKVSKNKYLWGEYVKLVYEEVCDD